MLRSLARRINPALNDLTGIAFGGTLLNTSIAILTFPFAVGALILIIWLTDWTIMVANWHLVLLLTGLSYLFTRFPFDIELEIQPGNLATVNGSLSGLVVWTALLLLGPSGLWVSIINALATHGVSLVREWRTPLRINHAGNGFLSVGLGAFSGLSGLWAYRVVGGQIPFASFATIDFMRALLAICVSFGISLLILGPLLWLVLGTAELGGSVGTSRVARLFGLGLLLTAISFPFGILAAGLYSLYGYFIFSVYMLAAILMTMLAYRLSQSARTMQQRSRELSALEQLGRAIMEGPPDSATLPELLSTHVRQMLPGSNACIWLWEEETLLLGQSGNEPAGYTTGRATLSDQRNIHHVQKGIRQLDQATTQQRIGLTVPVTTDDEEALGGLYILFPSSVNSEIPYLPAAQSLAAHVASARKRAVSHAQALANMRMSQELAVAGQIQASFLPDHLPPVEGWSLTATLIPARQTSGDFYDFIPLDEEHVGLLVADVADKGTGAALYMALSRTLIRTYATERPLEPAGALRAANERIRADTQSDQFVTVFYGVLNKKSGELIYCNAGHNPAYLFSAHLDEPLPLKQTGIPLGMFEGMEWRQESIQLPAGGLLLLYSDGVTEAQDEAQALFGEERLLQVASNCWGQPAREIQQTIIEAVDEFVDGAPQFDDMTLLILARD